MVRGGHAAPERIRSVLGLRRDVEEAFLDSFFVLGFGAGVQKAWHRPVRAGDDFGAGADGRQHASTHVTAKEIAERERVFGMWIHNPQAIISRLLRP